MAMLVFDLQRYHPQFTVDVVDQVIEDVRFGMEQNLYKRNQRRVASIKYLGRALHLPRHQQQPDFRHALVTFNLWTSCVH